MNREHMMKPTRVMVDVGRRRSWRTLWLRREVVWEIVWMGTIKGFSTTTMGSTTLELAESVEFLRKKYSVS